MRPFVRGLQGRSVSMRTPTKTRDTLSKVLPLRWSFGSKDRRKPSDPLPDTGPAPAELVEYLESGRRPRCTKDSIVTLMAAPPGGKEAPIGQKAQRAQGVSSSSMAGLSCVGRSVEEPDSHQVGLLLVLYIYFFFTVFFKYRVPSPFIGLLMSESLMFIPAKT